MKKRLFASLLLACALTVPFALSACDLGSGSDGDDNASVTDPEKDPSTNPEKDPSKDPEKDPSVSDLTEELAAALAQLISDGNVTSEIQIFVANYKNFTYADGKYTCAELAALNGFTCKNIEITLEDKKIASVKYELRTADKDTPDRLITIDKDGVTRTDIPKPTDDKPMDEDEWNEQATVFADVTNYTLERVLVESGDYIATMKLDGDTYYEEVNWAETIYDIEDGKYYRYHCAPFSGGEWVKTEVEASRYASIAGVPSLMVTVAAQAVQENFSKFTFDAGVYTAEELKVTYYYEFTLKDMEITVSGGKIVRAVCVLVGGYEGDGDERITVDHVGSTEIEFPETYTDNTTPTPPTPTTPSDDKGAATTADNWKKQFASTSFTVNTKLEGMELTYRIDGDNLECKEVYQGTEITIIAMLENGKYQTYMLYGPQWIKTEEDFLSGTENAVAGMQMMLSMFADDFGKFTFKDGKYTCAELNKTVINPGDNSSEEAICKNIEIVFNEKGGLVSIAFDAIDADQAEAHFEISDIGTTVVKAPDKYIEADL